MFDITLLLMLLVSFSVYSYWLILRARTKNKLCLKAVCIKSDYVKVPLGTHYYEYIYKYEYEGKKYLCQPDLFKGNMCEEQKGDECYIWVTPGDNVCMPVSYLTSLKKRADNVCFILLHIGVVSAAPIIDPLSEIIYLAICFIYTAAYIINENSKNIIVTAKCIKREDDSPIMEYEYDNVLYHYEKGSIFVDNTQVGETEKIYIRTDEPMTHNKIKRHNLRKKFYIILCVLSCVLSISAIVVRIEEEQQQKQEYYDEWK